MERSRKDRRKAQDKKMNQLSPVLKALVIAQKGPLVKGEIERTKGYTRELAVKLKEGVGSEQQEELE